MSHSPTVSRKRPISSCLKQPVISLKGVGPALAEKLLRLRITSVEDLLFHLPIRYEDRTQIKPMGRVQPYEQALIQGEVVNSQIVFGRRRSLVCQLTDATGSVTIRLFHFNQSQQKQLSKGRQVRCFGQLRSGGSGLEIYHPDYQVLLDSKAPLAKTLTPVYPATEGLGQQRLRSLISQALAMLKSQTEAEGFPELLPAGDTVRLLPSVEQSLDVIHEPPQDIDLPGLLQGEHPTLRRLVLEELVSHQLCLLQLKQAHKQALSYSVSYQKKMEQMFLKSLPFSLTTAQQRVWHEIMTDLQRGAPMLRMVQGDVGSGKTVVAALAAQQVCQQGLQVALMAPTEILAKQHVYNFKQWFAQQNIKVELLVGSMSGKQKDKVTESLVKGGVDILIGTHALFQGGVIYRQLALVIIDEQHRFGVEQRLMLMKKGENSGRVPHQLVMTATPIPRSLAMCQYGDLDQSIIDELPRGRKPIKTVVIANTRREEITQRICKVCEMGKQVYWVCTLIDESDELQLQAAEESLVDLQKRLGAEQVALVHGKMKAEEKNKTMAAFEQGEVRLLVATTVIEVGVNVPNATLMVIDNAERLGLAQLHQLRGRVGRGEEQSFCVLLYQSPLSQLAQQRLSIIKETNDGFVIAQRDLLLRGAGEVLGTKQTGMEEFRIADIARDHELVDEAMSMAKQINSQLPENIQPLIDRWQGQRAALASV